MMERPQPIPLVFWQLASRREPLRGWLKELSRGEQRVIGRDIAKVQFGWPIGLPVRRPSSGGPWQARSSSPRRREARVLFGFHDEALIVLHAFFKTSQRYAKSRVRTGAAAVKGIIVMVKKNPHIGSRFEDWLDEAGIREEVIAAAVKAVIAEQIAMEMKKKRITKSRMAALMKTSRAQVDRLLDPDNGSATLETLIRAARVVGRELRLELV
jgi:hypothetical protein